MPLFANTPLIQPSNVVGDSGWIDAQAFSVPYTLHFRNAVDGDAFDVRVSNSANQIPVSTDAGALADPGVVNGNSEAPDIILKISEAYRWLKVRRTNVGPNPNAADVMLFAQIRP